MPEPLYDPAADADDDELRSIIETQRQRLAFYAETLLGLGFDADDPVGAVE